jgi:DNA replication licensing factor MCM3
MVQDQDAEAAIDILKFALFKEAPKKKSRSKRARLDRPMGDSDSDDSDDDEDQDGRPSSHNQRRSSRVGQPPSSKGKAPASRSLEEDMEMMEIDADIPVEQELLATRRATRGSQGSSAPTQGSSTGKRATKSYVTGGDVHPSRQELFQSRTNRAIMNSEEDSLTFEDLLSAVNKGLELDELFGPSEATAILGKMNDANKLMFSEGVIYKI